MRSVEEQKGEQLFDSYYKALQSLTKQGFKYRTVFY